MTRVCIYGAGLVGCYLGGRLLAAGADTRLIGRPAMGDALRREGLATSCYDGRSWRTRPGSILFGTDAAMAADADLVLVTVKSGATAEAARELAAVLAPTAIVVSFQNGIGNGAVLKQALGERLVLDGIVPFNIVAKGPGHFHQASEGHLYVQAAAGADASLAVFTPTGMLLERPAEMRPVQWAKLLLNLNNAVNALANLPLKQELSQRGYRRCLAAAQREALGLLDEAGIRPARLTPLPPHRIPTLLELPDFVFALLARRMLAIDPSARSSMAEDLAAGRPTEVDWINGEVVRLAEGLGRTAPVNARLCALVHAAESVASRPSWSPAALLAELRQAAESGRT
uniref:2-dehydropantoate 2-reductase n=1 Tax=Bosea sp. NBC_00436 TaxID=2969620 RepID=A0A9E7ZRM9_9HYPH